MVGAPASPAVASSRSQSRRAQARATETAASLRTSRFMRSSAGAQTRDDVRDRMAVQVVDQPAERGARFHPTEKADQLAVIEMMGEQGADHSVRPERRRQLEDIAR